MNSKTVLLSGGTSGIGRGTVLRLLEDGFNVSTFSKDEKGCASLKKELGKKFDEKKFLVLQGNVSIEKNLEKILKETLAKFKSIDILINNAGTGYFRDCDKMDRAKFEDMIQTNLVGVALLTNLIVPSMKKQKSGLIINLVSISGKKAFANGEFYSATKFGVMGYSEGIRHELKEFGIRVSTVCPGMVNTSFFDSEELKRRKQTWKGVKPAMLEVGDITRIISLICNQAEHSDIQDITIMPF